VDRAPPAAAAARIKWAFVSTMYSTPVALSATPRGVSRVPVPGGPSAAPTAPVPARVRTVSAVPAYSQPRPPAAHAAAHVQNAGAAAPPGHW
jgi:hypothetical protein